MLKAWRNACQERIAFAWRRVLLKWPPTCGTVAVLGGLRGSRPVVSAVGVFPPICACQMLSRGGVCRVQAREVDAGRRERKWMRRYGGCEWHAILLTIVSCRVHGSVSVDQTTKPHIACSNVQSRFTVTTVPAEGQNVNHWMPYERDGKGGPPGTGTPPRILCPQHSFVDTLGLVCVWRRSAGRPAR